MNLGLIKLIITHQMVNLYYDPAISSYILKTGHHC